MYKTEFLFAVNRKSKDSILQGCFDLHKDYVRKAS